MLEDKEGATMKISGETELKDREKGLLDEDDKKD